MIFDSSLLNSLSAQARENPRLRQNLDLRNSPEDKSQRMLNAMEPGTLLPVHRHRGSSETVVVIRGAIRNNVYDDSGELVESYEVRAGGDVVGFSVPAGTWHRAEALEPGTVILECKDGPWEPLGEEDILR